MPRMPNSKPDKVVLPSEDNHLRIRYEVPLTWLLSGAVFLACQAAVLSFSAQRQGELIAALTDSQRQLGSEVRGLRDAQTPRDLKDQQHDFQLADHERRLLGIEARALKK
jgi:hypothetical protein